VSSSVGVIDGLGSHPEVRSGSAQTRIAQLRMIVSKHGMLTRRPSSWATRFDRKTNTQMSSLQGTTIRLSGGRGQRELIPRSIHGGTHHD
jgi:hypothetical protein